MEFIFRSGDIDRRHSAASMEDMQKGAAIHRKLQEEQKEKGYHAEVPLKITVEKEEYLLTIEGRADGVIITGDGPVVIDEIKSIHADINDLEEPVPVHLAQARLYASIYASQHELDDIGVRMTYCSLDEPVIRHFSYSYTRQETEEFFEQLVSAYHRWALFKARWGEKRDASAQNLEFPYPYRKGQRELAADVYRTIYHKKRLFLMAPTGVGKTLSVTFPGVKAMGEGRVSRIFYLTGKNVTGQAAVNAFQTMGKCGLKVKTTVINGREKVCLMDSPRCNPDDCPYAKGHYDRVNEALYSLLTQTDTNDREEVRSAAERFMVCPYELALDLAGFSDVIICDYNYCFDPGVSLGDYFTPGISGNELILVDEAHNLVERAREMYSAQLNTVTLANVRKKLRALVKNADFNVKVPKRAVTALYRMIRALEQLKDENGDFASSLDISAFAAEAVDALSLFEEMMRRKELRGLFDDEELLEFYFDLNFFVYVFSIYDENYVNYIEAGQGGNIKLKLLCFDPSHNLMEYLGDRSAVFFSATLIPVGYYIDLISGDRGDYTVYARSTFDSRRCAHFIVTDVSSVYKQRNDDTYYKIANVINEVISEKKGNYMMFFPSYSFMEEVLKRFELSYPEKEAMIVRQDRDMSEAEREDFINLFKEKNDDGVLGFCVLGGIFSEGIDLKGDHLIGTVITGTGLPMITKERELLKQSFDARGMRGFDYAYRFPGLIKVLQAAGRVIRTEEDTGVVALLDERFTRRDYQGMFPEEWTDISKVDSGSIGRRVKGFWESAERGYPCLSSDEND